MAQGAAAAEAPVLAYVTVGLLALLAWIVLRGLRVVWVYTFGALFLALAGVGIPTGVFGRIHPLGFLHDANRAMMNTLEVAAQRTEHAVGYLFHGAAVIQGWVARELYGLAEDVYGWASWLQHSHLPRWVKALIYAALPPLVLPLIAHALAGVHPTRIFRYAIHAVGVTRRQVKALIAAALATAGAVVLPLPHVFPRIRSLERDRIHIWRLLRKYQTLFGAAGAALLVARALGLGTARCVRSGNIGRAARLWCGLDSSIVNALLADLAIASGTVSLLELAKASQKVAPVVATSLVYFVDDLPIELAEAERIAKRSLAILEGIA